MKKGVKVPTLADWLFAMCRDPSGKDMAKALGVSAAYVSDLRNGRRDWTPSLIDRAAKAYRLSDEDCGSLHNLGARTAGWRIWTS